MLTVIMAYLKEDKLVKNLIREKEIHFKAVYCTKELYLLRRIVKILLSYKISLHDIKTLDIVITIHLRLMSIETEPLTGVCTLRFESRCQPYKSNSLNRKNQVNECLLLARKGFHRNSKLYASNYQLKKLKNMYIVKIAIYV
uniref:Reverse transcriptase n=1 Tax=Strongyloides venezuelensis TaxID=75913 RepID=A0A0K0G590_STRVS